MYGYFLSFFKPERGRSSIGFVRDAQVDMLGYESALPFLTADLPSAARH